LSEAFSLFLSVAFEELAPLSEPVACFEVVVVVLVASEAPEAAGVATFVLEVPLVPPVVVEVEVELEAAGLEADAAVADGFAVALVVGVDEALGAAVAAAVAAGVVVAAAVAVAVARGVAVAAGEALTVGAAVAEAVAEGEAEATGATVAVAVAAGVAEAIGVAVAFVWALMPVCVVTPLRPPPLPRLMLIPAAGCTP
jgi:hypothetical protein